MDGKIVELNVRFKNTDPDRELVLPYEVGKRSCHHRSFIVDESKAEVECADCGEKVNPMWALTRLCTRESRWHQAHDRYQDEMKRINERSRTKCDHCGKMTRISRR